MDSHDKEFEKFLQQFELRQPRAPFSDGVPQARPAPRHRWWMAAAAAAVIVVALIGVWSRVVPTESGAIVEDAGDSSFKSGENVTLGDVVQSGQSQALTLTLKDGSSVEMHPQSRLSMHTADDRQQVRLETGSIVAVAANQSTGRLYVRTRDAEASGLGAIFMVETEAAGTRVGVIEGEVEVRSGATTRKLFDGEQFSTNPAAGQSPLAEAIAWSRRAAEFTAKLPVQPIVAFTPDPIERLVRKETIPAPEPLRRAPSQHTPQQAPTSGTAPPPPSREVPLGPAAPVAGPTEDPRIEEYRRAKLALDEITGKFPPTSLIPDLGIARLRFERAKEKLSSEELETANKPKAPQPDSGADSAGVQILNKACGGCHLLEVARNARFDTRDAYASLVSRQVSMGASLTQAEFNILVDYLFKTYGARKGN